MISSYYWITSAGYCYTSFLSEKSCFSGNIITSRKNWYLIKFCLFVIRFSVYDWCLSYITAPEIGLSVSRQKERNTINNEFSHLTNNSQGWKLLPIFLTPQQMTINIKINIIAVNLHHQLRAYRENSNSHLRR